MKAYGRWVRISSFWNNHLSCRFSPTGLDKTRSNFNRWQRNVGGRDHMNPNSYLGKYTSKTRHLGNWHLLGCTRFHAYEGFGIIVSGHHGSAFFLVLTADFCNPSFFLIALSRIEWKLHKGSIVATFLDRSCEGLNCCMHWFQRRDMGVDYCCLHI